MGICLLVVSCVHTAMPMAICDSVTVSIGEETSGAFSVILFVRADVRSCTVNKVSIINVTLQNITFS